MEVTDHPSSFSPVPWPVGSNSLSALLLYEMWEGWRIPLTDSRKDRKMEKNERNFQEKKEQYSSISFLGPFVCSKYNSECPLSL